MDNAPHHPGLPYAPHQLHVSEDEVEGFRGNPDIFVFIDEMERTLVRK